MRPLFSRLGLGKLVYHLYHRPTGSIRDCIAAGGPLVLRRTRLGESAMIQAARELPVPSVGSGRPITLHLLTGRRFWHQTAFCLWTFARASNRPIIPVLYDDGTLAPEHQAPLLRLFPAARFVAQTEIVARLDAYLPVDQFPYLRDRWLKYPNIRKLIDPHLGSSDWKLILDSDLLFFRSPEFLINWCDAPDRPLHAVDCETSYGYPDAILTDLASSRLPKR